MLILGKMPLYKFILYTIAQCLGAWLASLMVFLVYLNQLQKYKNGMYSIDTAGIFATYPNDIHDSTNTFSMFFDQFFSTSLFIIAILAITDKNNTVISHELVSILIGASLVIIGTSFGFNCGFAVNPARDFAPRIFTAMFGWGSKTFSAANGFFWIPVFAPFLGSAFGTGLYSLFISNHWFSDDV
jgi:MIP family channel proteins